MENGWIYRVSKNYLLSNIQGIFAIYEGSSSKTDILIAVLKTGNIKPTQNYIFFLQKKCYTSVKEKWVFRVYLRKKIQVAIVFFKGKVLFRVNIILHFTTF